MNNEISLVVWNVVTNLFEITKNNLSLFVYIDFPIYFFRLYLDNGKYRFIRAIWFYLKQYISLLLKSAPDELKHGVTFLKPFFRIYILNIEIILFCVFSNSRKMQFFFYSVCTTLKKKLNFVFWPTLEGQKFHLCSDQLARHLESRLALPDCLKKN